MLNVYELNVFVQAAETQNFSETARRLHLTQPAVSLNIKALEKQLGIDLFRNIGRNVVLTEAGYSLLPMARELVALSNHIEESVCALRGETIGLLTIGCAASAGKYLLPAIIGRFKQMYPKVKVSMIISDCETLLKKLIDREINIGITCMVDKNPELEYRDFVTDELVLIVAPQHPWATRQSVSLEEIQGQDVILREEGAGSRRMILGEMARHGMVLEDLQVMLELGSCEAVTLAVESGLGISFVCKLAALRSLETGRLVAVPVRDAQLSHPIYLVGNRKQACSCAQLKFCDLVHSMEMQTILKALNGNSERVKS